MSEASDTTIRRWALLVGCDQYREKGLPVLSNVANDVQALRSVLSRNGYHDQEIISLTGEAATRDAIKTAIDYVEQMIRPEDFLLVFLTGAGDLGDGKAYLLTFDTKIDDYENTAVELNWLMSRMSRMAISGKVLVIDSCHSGGAAARMDPLFAKEIFDERNELIVMTSCDAKEVSFVDNKSGIGIFTFYFLEALNGEADREQKGFVTMSDVFHYVHNNVKLWSIQKTGRTQSPQMISRPSRNDIVISQQINSIPPMKPDFQNGMEIAATVDRYEKKVSREKQSEIPTIGVLTVIGTEQQAMKNALGMEEMHRVAGKGCLWYEKVIKTKHSGLVRVQLHALGEAGNAASAADAARVISGGVQFMLLCGIAAGYKGKVKIGDVIVPRAIVDTTVKMVEDGRSRPRPTISGPLKGVLQMVAAVKVDEKEWHKLFHRLAGKRLIPPLGQEQEYTRYVAIDPTLHENAILSDNDLLRDKQILIDAANHLHQQIRAGEMEAAGFVHACISVYPPIPWYVVRGISDFGDSLKNDQFHSLAASAVAAYTAILIRDVLDLRIWKDLPSDNAFQIRGSNASLF